MANGPLSDSPVVFDFIAGEVRGSIGPPPPDRMWPHYFSTYCIHGHHEDCRLTCKVCGERCLCDCHAAIKATAHE